MISGVAARRDLATLTRAGLARHVWSPGFHDTSWQ
jgi:hypothetical protein